MPTLLIATSVLTHALPSKPVAPMRPVRRTQNMTERDELLANAAQYVREQREAETNDNEQRKQERLEPPEGTAPTGIETKS